MIENKPFNETQLLLKHRSKTCSVYLYLGIYTFTSIGLRWLQEKCYTSPVNDKNKVMNSGGFNSKNRVNIIWNCYRWCSFLISTKESICFFIELDSCSSYFNAVNTKFT